ncbi:MAG: osmoprotectant transport system substrate-binding protein [Actinomycetota bacterium]|nr:osmoprotectant transport system substrate-binding protein [Actinomycetota bacterium]
MAAFSLLSAACGSSDDKAGSGSTTATTVAGPTIKIRGQDFSESATIAQVYGQYLRAKGYTVDILTPAGFRDEAISALKNGDVNLIVDYIGGDATALAPDTKVTAEPDQVLGVIKPAFAAIGATVLDYADANDGDAFVVRGDSPAVNISDVKNLDYVLGASPQCETRPQCYIGFTDPAVYGITFKEYKKIDFGPQLGAALSAKEVDAVVWNTTAPQIKENGFKVLEDDKRLFPAQNIAPIVATPVLDAHAKLAADLNALSEVITTDDLVSWNVETDVKFRESDEVATEWLKKKGLD